MDKMTQMLEQLAAKMGTTVEHLWPLYVQYTWACALTGVIVGALMLVVAALLFRWITRMDCQKWGDDRIVVVLLTAGLAITGTIALAVCSPALLSPEGAAVYELLDKAMK